MIRKILMAVLAFTLCAPAISFAGAKDYATELKQEEKKLIEATKQLTTQKKKLRKLASEYEKADMAMRQQLAKDKPSVGKKEFIRTSKMEQKKLRGTYYKNKKPLIVENDKLKRKYHASKKAIKRLTKTIDRQAKDPDNEIYKAKIDKLKVEINARKEKLHNAIAKVREQSDTKIAAITDMSKKSTIKNRILSDSKAQELVLRKAYTVDKNAIVAKIDAAKSEYKNNLKLWRIKTASKRKEDHIKSLVEQRKKIDAQPVAPGENAKKRATTNFSPSN